MPDQIADLFGNPDEEAMYQQALRVPLVDKIEMAIGLIKLYEPSALRLSEDGYYVCFSGGKDSIVMAKLFEMAGVKYTLNYSNVTIDPPELVWFVKREYPQAIWHSVGTPLPYYMVNKTGGPPTRLVRWCCEVYKEQGGKEHFRSIGVRAAESARRKGIWKTVSKDRDSGNPILCPILYWTDADVWNFIRQQNMKYCELYDQGYKRLGCIGCPLSSRRKEEFKRYPNYERMWQKGFQMYWDKWKTVPRKDGEERWSSFKTWQELWDWWISDKSVNDTDQPDCQMYLW